MKWSNGDSPAAASGSNRPRSRRAAIAIPTADANPWPSGPVVISTPWCGGTPDGPGSATPRSAAPADRRSPGRTRPGTAGCTGSGLECPADSTNRSRPTQCGSAGSCRITRWNSVYANGANDIAVPGWPLPTFCTASAANTRAVSTARLSNSDQSSGTMRRWSGRGCRRRQRNRAERSRWASLQTGEPTARWRAARGTCVTVMTFGCVARQA